MGYKRVLNDAEVDFLAAYAKSAGSRKILAAEIRRDILPQLKKVNGGVTREINTVYVRLCDMQKRVKEAAGKSEVVAPALTAARKVWAEIRPLIVSALSLGAGKAPDDYLKPLDELVAASALVQRNGSLEKKVAALEKEIAALRLQRRAFKKVAAYTCRRRANLTALLEEIKQKDGVDVCSLASEEED